MSRLQLSLLVVIFAIIGFIWVVRMIAPYLPYLIIAFVMACILQLVSRH